MEMICAKVKSEIKKKKWLISGSVSGLRILEIEHDW